MAFESFVVVEQKSFNTTCRNFCRTFNLRRVKRYDREVVVFKKLESYLMRDELVSGFHRPKGKSS